MPCHAAWPSHDDVGMSAQVRVPPDSEQPQGISPPPCPGIAEAAYSLASRRAPGEASELGHQCQQGGADLLQLGMDCVALLRQRASWQANAILGMLEAGVSAQQGGADLVRRSGFRVWARRAPTCCSLAWMASTTSSQGCPDGSAEAACTLACVRVGYQPSREAPTSCSLAWMASTTSSQGCPDRMRSSAKLPQSLARPHQSRRTMSRPFASFTCRACSAS